MKRIINRIFQGFNIKFVVLFMMLLFSSGLTANGDVPYACLFERPFLFGASITAGYGSPIDGTKGMFFKNSGPFVGSQNSPLTTMAKEVLGEESIITNKAEIVNQMPFGSIGFDQFRHYVGLHSSGAAVKSEYSLFGSLDGFYWPAIYRNYACSNVLYGAEQIIATAHALKTPLVLGTVPIENIDHIHPLVVAAGLQSGGPRAACAMEINSLIHQQCKLENNCFIVDMFQVVENLRSEEGINFEGTVYKAINYIELFAKYKDNPERLQLALDTTPMLRFDGVHLSEAGVRYVSHLIDHELSKAKSLCQ